MPRIAALLLGLLMISSAASGSDFDPGPAIGTPMPSFEATDQKGHRLSSDQLSGEKGLLLLFFRSADW